METIWLLVLVGCIVIGLVTGDWSHFNSKNGASSEDDRDPAMASFDSDSVYHNNPSYDYLPGNLYHKK